MRARAAVLPIWVLGLVSGLLFGAATTVIAGLRGDGDRTLLIFVGVLAGTVFGTVRGVFLKRDYGAARAALAALPIEQRRAVLRATGRGRVPEDPVVRAAALRQAVRTRDQLVRRARLTVAVFAAAMVGYALLALTRSPWWWLNFVVFGGLLAAQLWAPRRAERRIADLSAPPGKPTHR